MIVVRAIAYEAVRARPELVAEYAKETRIAGMAMPAPQWDAYAAMEASGLYRVLGAFADDELIGFAGVLTTVNPHHAVKIATVVDLFVAREFRNGSAFGRLMRAVAAHGRAAGCESVIYSARAGSALERALAKRHERTNSVFCFQLE